MVEKNVIMLPRKYTIGECCAWGYRSTCMLGWIGPCGHGPCSNTLCTKAKKEKSVFYSKYCPDATCIIAMTCKRCKQIGRKMILKKDWAKKDYTKTENILYICENCEQFTTVPTTVVGAEGATTEVETAVPVTEAGMEGVATEVVADVPRRYPHAGRSPWYVTKKPSPWFVIKKTT
jgi:hypothetical protein